MSKRPLLLLLPLLLLPVILHAQWRVEGTFRPRSEYRNGYGLLRTPASEPAYFISQRTRLAVSYEADSYKIKVSGQDVRVWGEVDQLQDNPSVNIHEAWARLSLSNRFQLKLGRQELVYGNQRLLGSVNWTQQGRSHDALLLQYNVPASNFQLDLGGAYNQTAENLLGNNYRLNNYKILSFAWLNKKIGDMTVSVTSLADGFEKQADEVKFRYTYGSRLKYEWRNAQLSGSIYGQQGDDAYRNNISAYMVTGQLQYQLRNWHFKMGYDYLSGGSADDSNPVRHAFSTLYATNHKFYGNMDYFLNIPVDTRGGGLQDRYLNAGYWIDNSATVSLTYHHFALAHAIRNPVNSTEIIERQLGSEFDLKFGYQLNDDVSFSAGYSLMLSTESLDQLQQRNGRATQHWGWVMLTLSPQTIFD